MFIVSGTKISMSRGDTGAIIISSSGYTFSSDDRALFTVKNSSGTAVIRKVFELEDGAFTMTFQNQDTDTLQTGNYSWDVRYVINPYYDDGEIVNGDQVWTPNEPMTLIILPTVGDV